MGGSGPVSSNGPTRYNGFPHGLFQPPFHYSLLSQRTQLDPAMRGLPHYARFLLPSLKSAIAPASRWGLLAVLGLYWIVEPSQLGWWHVPFIRNRKRHVANREAAMK